MAVRASSDRSKLAADALDHGTAAAGFDVGVRSAVAASAARWVPLSSHPLSRGTGARRSPTSAAANVVPIIPSPTRSTLAVCARRAAARGMLRPSATRSSGSSRGREQRPGTWQRVLLAALENPSSTRSSSQRRRRSPERIVLANPVLRAFRKQRALPAIRALNKSAHSGFHPKRREGGGRAR